MKKAREQDDSQLSRLRQIAFDDERRVVGGCLLYPELMSKCGVLAQKHFTNSDCGLVWSVMAEFHKQGTSWDLSSVESELGRRGIAEPASILERLSEGVVATVAAIERAAVRVRQTSLRLSVLKEIGALQRSLLDASSDVNSVLRTANRTIDSFATEYGNIYLVDPLNGPNLGTPVAGCGILDEIAAFIARFVVLSEPELLVISLWIGHTWAFEASDATPYLAVTSPEMRSGKTRLLEILDLLVRDPWRTGRVTPAVLARKIDSDTPTLLLDEWDATARGNQEFSETLRGIINAGHRRNGKVSVCGPKSSGYQPTDFSVFCPKVIAGIGKVPETIADRSIPIRLKRKAPRETVERFRIKVVSGEANQLKARLSGWISGELEQLKDALPQLPECLSDRQQDGAEPLLAIADAAGGNWPVRARAALRDLHSSNNAKEESVGVLLLSDIRDIFYERSAEALASRELVEALVRIEGRPWPSWDNARPMTPNVLARLLAPFDILPRNVRIRSIVKGYRRECFSDSWTRYLSPLIAPVPSPTDATPLQSAPELIRPELGRRLPEADVAASKTSFRPQLERIVAM